MTGFLVALLFLTRLPAPRVAPEAAGDLARAAPWLPVVGALVGLLMALAAAAGAAVTPWVGALLGLIASVLVTGGLHLEGLGDVADAQGAAHGDPKRFIAVARDPHVGGFGVIAVALQLLAKLVLLAAVLERASLLELVAGLGLVGAWTRWAPLALGALVPPLAEGLASRLAAGIAPRVVVLWGAALALATLFCAPLLIAALPLALALALYWHLRLGGLTGDCHGASIEILETLLLLCLAAA